MLVVPRAASKFTSGGFENNQKAEGGTVERGHRHMHVGFLLSGVICHRKCSNNRAEEERFPRDLAEEG